MKKNFKIIVLVLIASFFFQTPINTLAFDIISRDIHDTLGYQYESLNFKSLIFKDNSKTSALSFGISGYVYSNYNEEITLISKTKYYDALNNLVAETTTNQVLNPKTTNLYNNTTNLNKIKSGYSVNDIAYYNLELQIVNNQINNNTPSELSKYKNKDYVIDSYNINIVVNEDNSFDIEETITAYFNQYKHGIFRTIPLRNTVTRLDGTSSKNRARISNIMVSDTYTTSRENGNYKIKIGSPSKTIIGKKNYTISYNYQLSKDNIKEYDELYYNIIGNEWDTVIGNITFTIQMPKEFDATKLGFSHGSFGSTDNQKIKYQVNGNTITGSYNGILDAYNALTVRVELEEGYFSSASNLINNGIYLMIMIPLIGLTIIFLLWYFKGKDEKTIDTIEFYPPKGFNSLEIGFLYKGKASTKDVVSLLIYLANKGYIKISESTKKTRIIKLKEYDGNNEYERIFFEGLFESNTRSFVATSFNFLNTNNDTTINSLPTKTTDDNITINSLKNSFYRVIDKILKKINTKNNRNQIFEKLNLFLPISIIAISAIILIAIPTITYDDFANLLSIFFIMIFYAPFIIIIFKFDTQDKSLTKIFTLMFVIIHFSIFFLTTPIARVLFEDKFYLFAFVIGLICIIGMIILTYYMPKRNKYGLEILGKIKGFKNFLETAEKEKLEMLVNQDPEYFYNILPYTYVLDVSDKWIEKFKDIAIHEPNWYDGIHDFNPTSFNTTLNETMKSVNNTMSSRPSSSGGSSGSSSSGGGSSGGGSGGGGGGSW